MYTSSEDSLDAYLFEHCLIDATLHMNAELHAAEAPGLDPDGKHLQGPPDWGQAYHTGRTWLCANC